MAYTIDEASEILSMSRAQLYRLADYGEIETIKIGKSRRITSKQLEDFLFRLEEKCAPVRLSEIVKSRARSTEKK